MFFGIILLPDESFSETLINYSQAIATKDPVMTLHKHLRPPHVTIVHLEGEAQSITSLWKNFSLNSPAFIKVGLAGLMFNIWPGEGIYFGIEAKQTSELKSIHNLAVKLSNSHSCKITNPHQDDYVPHLTLGALNKVEDANLEIWPEVIGKQFRAQVALGKMGERGTFPEVITKL